MLLLFVVAAYACRSAQSALVLRAYAKSYEGTTPAGFASDESVERLYKFAQSGVPVVFGPGRELGRITKEDIALDRFKVSSAEVQRVRDALDARAGGTPAVVESPFAGLMVPRVAADGALRNVALVNLQFDAQEPVRLRLRGVPSGAKSAIWREMRREPVALALERDGGLCRVEIPSIGAWNGGFVEFLSERRALPCGAEM